MEDEFVDVKGYEGYYVVSKDGIVKRLAMWSDRTPQSPQYTPERIVKINISPYGYYSCKFCMKGVKSTILMHRLIATAFIPNPENKRTVNHKDGNKLNNHIDNLEWATDKEQIIHAYDNNLNHRNYLKVYNNDGSVRHESITITNLAIELNVTRDHVYSTIISKKKTKIKNLKVEIL